MIARQKIGGSVFYSASADILEGMKTLAESEYVPVLAQPEKYPSLQEYLDICRQIVDTGARLQINVSNVFSDNLKIRDTVGSKADTGTAGRNSCRSRSREATGLLITVRTIVGP